MHGTQLSLATRYSPEIHSDNNVKEWLKNVSALISDLLSGLDVTNINTDELEFALEEVSFGA